MKPVPTRPPAGSVAVARQAKGTVVVTTGASDSHTWNLVLLQLLIEELGYDVVNLGPCVPDDVLVSRCAEIRPDLIVFSSVNGHGCQDGLRAIKLLREAAETARTPAVIGGKLGTTGSEGSSYAQELAAAGFDAVFEDGADPYTAFPALLDGIFAAELRELA
ncbi:cobalamin B12-binding domain-containing protein [Streptomyces sp. NPDC053560]|uniref:cobalamin B12-binding domain-containing protein n=1 Tax=Streptomyces sp. NPDC053560 TaxID=3365711 RepID=UPI0037D4B153